MDREEIVEALTALATELERQALLALKILAHRVGEDEAEVEQVFSAEQLLAQSTGYLLGT